MSQQAVIDAWADLTNWVENTLPADAVNEALPNITEDLGDIGACNAFNVSIPDNTTTWGSTGDAVITITGLQITTMSGVQIQAATAQSDTAFQLPLQFGSLQVEGNYSYTEPCAEYDAGHQISSANATGNGTISWSISNGTLTYAATLNGNLSITGVTVGGNASVSANPNDGGLPSWLVSILNFFSSFNEQTALNNAVASVFQNASFTNTMLDMLNSELQGGN